MDQRQFFLRDLLTVIFKHKALIITLPILVFALVFVGNYVWPPTYESSAKVRIMRGREVSQTDTTVTHAAQELTMIQLGVEDINSEIEMIHSRDLLERVVTELGLDRDRAFPYGAGPLQVPFRAAKQTVSLVLWMLRIRERPTPLRQAMDELDGRIITAPVRDSHVLEVKCRLGDSNKARDVLKKIIDVYQDLHIEIFANKKSSPFFAEQKERIEKSLAVAQKDLQEFRKSANISLLDTEKELLLEQYTEATRILSQLTEAETVIRQGDLDSSLMSTVASETESTVVREMQLRLLELLLEQDRRAQSLGPKHPQVEGIAKQIREAQTRLVEAIATTKKITENKLTVINARLEQLNETKARLDNLEREESILASNYEFYSGKHEQSIVADELAAAAMSNIKVASSPTLPVDPIRPNKLLNLGLALVGGLIAALALAFLLDYLDHGLKTPEDVEFYVKVAPLASFFNKAGQPLNPREAERLAVLLEAGGVDKRGQCLQVTSTIPNEGANLVASALGEAFAKDPESRTLLVDFAGTIPLVRSGQGIVDVLLGEATLDEIAHGDENLAIVGRGSQGDYPSYLWGSDRMQELMTRLRDAYRYIVFNVGPVLASQDALKLARYADGIILVIKADSTRREVVNRATAMLKESGEKIVGAVLTERTQTIPDAVYRRI